ncbi:deleted in malignant brain tumors 1 protein [Folsomia candida]|uniref:deleted in malignant brain tumors 1 protein n=1 Tax=Folsomia candida TaxID=158441 RepID=UPI000B8EEB12|nr:deleted in malignant brain tumors 1 protein [Folsomia candida]
MNSSLIILVIASCFAVVAAAPQPKQEHPEDPVPTVNVTTCGGLVDATSATIEFQLGGSIRADMRCVWIVRAPYFTKRFNLVSSGLKESDGLYFTPQSKDGLGTSQKLGTIGQNVTIHQKIVIITLIVGHAPTFGFKLEYYSSGSNWNTDLTGYAVLATTKGNLTYPINGGNYRSFENALFPIAPTVPGQPTLRFTRVDLEVHSSCLYDSIKTYNWFNGEYRQVSMICGNIIPPSVTLQDGLGFVLFVSDINNERTGFEFAYE